MGATEGRRRSDAWESFVSVFAPRWSFSFLGTGFVLVWIQCILYARYIWVDSGLTTVAINFSRCACIVVLGAFALRKVFSARTEKTLGWVSISLMTLGSLLFFVQAMFPWMPLTTPAAVFSGVGLAWGGGMWMKVYERLDIGEALLYTFLSLALSTLIGVFIGFVAEDIAFFISMLLPVTTYTMYRQSTKLLDARERSGIGVPPPRDDAYASEPRRTVVRLAVGIALFSFVLGASRGFPFGESIELAPGFQLMQHLGVSAIGLGIVWWGLVAKRRFRFSTLWQIQLGALAVGVILLSTLNPFASQFGATLIAITNLFQVAFLWFVSYDVARHRALPSYVILGFFWLIHLLFRETGRLVMWWIGGGGGMEMMLVIAVMICLIALSVGILLTDALPGNRPLFADLCANHGVGSGSRNRLFAKGLSASASEMPSDASQVGSASASDVLQAGNASASDAGKVPSETLPSSAHAAGMAGVQTGAARDVLVDEAANAQASEADRRSNALRERFNLTQRETEVALLLSEGRSSTYIAGELVLSDNTVRSYVKNIYQKLDVHSKQDLIDFMKEL